MAKVPTRSLDMTLIELANLFGVSPTVVRQWVTSPGYPESTGKLRQAYLYPADKIVAIRLELAKGERGKDDAGDVVTITDAQRRKEVALAELRELELAEKRGEVIPIDEIEDTLSARESNLRTLLLGIPSELAPRIAKTNRSTSEVEAMIREAIGDRLNRFADETVDDAAA